MKYIEKAIEQLNLYIKDNEENRRRVGFALNYFWKRRYKNIRRIIEQLEKINEI